MGGKFTRNAQWARNSNDLDKWLYVGPGGGVTGSFSNYPSPFVLLSAVRTNPAFPSIRSTAGRRPGRSRIATTSARSSHEHPEYFLQSLPANAATASTAGISLANYESGKYLNQPTYDLVENVAAGYLMANTRLKQLQLQGGVRYEHTKIDSTELNPYSNEKVAAAGYRHAVHQGHRRSPEQHGRDRLQVASASPHRLGRER